MRNSTSHCTATGTMQKKAEEALKSTSAHESAKQQQEEGESASTSSAGARRLQLPTWSTLEAILLDVDGTLCDSDQLHYIPFYEQLMQQGVFSKDEPLSWPFFKEHISGQHNSSLFPWLYPNTSQSQQEALALEKEARFRELLNESGLQPTSGLQPLLDKASQKDIPICCVTNAPRENVESMLDALSAAGLSSYKLKESLVVANELSEAKPSGLPYSHACIDICQASPEDAIAFEDSTGGIRSAKNAQIAAVVGVETSKDADSLIAAGATISVRDFADEKLLNLLDG